MMTVNGDLPALSAAIEGDDHTDGANLGGGCATELV
jgi:hypothetical protein